MHLNLCLIYSYTVSNTLSNTTASLALLGPQEKGFITTNYLSTNHTVTHHTRLVTSKCFQPDIIIFQKHVSFTKVMTDFRYA